MNGLLPQLSGSGEAERLLLREISHRINNELASAISLVAVAASRCSSSDARAALAAVQDRLESFARVHHSLQMPEYTTTIDLAAYIHQLCRAISHSKIGRQGDRTVLVHLSAQDEFRALLVAGNDPVRIDYKRGASCLRRPGRLDSS